MDITALKKTDFEVWVPFTEDASVFVRHITREEFQALRQKATRTEFNRRTHLKEETFDPAEFDRLLGLAVVRGWKGFTADGEEFLFSAENVELLMSKWNDFARFVGDVCLDLERLIDAEKEETRKNSESTSAQKPTTRG